MIWVNDVSKKFNDINALNNVSINIDEGKVFGLIGTNGAGKSTLLRLIAGVLSTDDGVIEVDGEPVFENENKKQSIFFMSDDHYYLPSSTPMEMANFYKNMYPAFNMEQFKKLLDTFMLSGSRKINTFSKGMKKQLLVALGLSSMAKYLLCDETFDGLDPIVRQATKALFIAQMEERNLTPIIASHNLRELEDICDDIGMLHQGGIVLNDSLDDMKLKLCKLQCVFRNADDLDKLKERLEILNSSNRGSLFTLTVRGTFDECKDIIKEMQPVFFEALPLSLEEIYISETEVIGYDIRSKVL